MNDKMKLATAALNKLFSTYPQSQASDEAMQAYFDAIEPYDIRDIEAAVKALLTGSILDLNAAFAPSAPLLGAVVRQQMNERLEREQRDRNRRPQLPPPDIVKSPESKARIQSILDKITGKWEVGFEAED